MKRLPIFFDTEFSSLEVDAKMLSAGFVSANGQELYVEVKDSIDPAKCSPFVLETVLPLLQGGPHLFTLSEIARKLKGWIEAMSSEVVLVSDLPAIDWPLIHDLFEAYGWPENLSKRCEPVSFWIPKHSEEVFHCALKEYWLEHESKRHHALIDAMSLFDGWGKVNSRR